MHCEVTVLLKGLNRRLATAHVSTLSPITCFMQLVASAGYKQIPEGCSPRSAQEFPCCCHTLGVWDIPF